jgi:glycosyltransferase involved in cell wall biosynthesis
MNRTRVLHVHSGNLYGGVETMMLTLARESLRVATPVATSAGGIGPSPNRFVHEFALAFDSRIASELRASGAVVQQLGEVRARHPLSVLRARRRLAKLLAADGWRAVICHMPWAHALFAPTVRRAGRPLVFWMHTTARGHWTERLAARTPPDLAICNSLFTGVKLPQIFPHRAAEIVYCPVDISAPRLSSAGRLALRGELATPPDAIVIVQVGRMESLKGHATLLHALARLRDRNWLCWQVGAGQRPHERVYQDGLMRLAHELEIAHRIKFLGHRSDVANLLDAADIYCQPNLEPDAFGISFIEALGAGLPVVTTALGGALEIVDQSCGALVRPNDPAALADALARLLDDPGKRRRLGEAGPVRARELCDPATVLRRLDDLIERLPRETSSI